MREYLYQYRWWYAIFFGICMGLLLFVWILLPSLKNLQQLANDHSHHLLNHQKNDHPLIRQNNAMTIIHQLGLKYGVQIEFSAWEQMKHYDQLRVHSRGLLPNWIDWLRSLQQLNTIVIFPIKWVITSNQLMIADWLVILLPMELPSHFLSPFHFFPSHFFCQTAVERESQLAARQLPLTAMHLVGRVTTVDRSRAYLQLPNGQLQSVQVGDVVGLEKQRVMRIDAQGIIFVQSNGKQLSLGLMR